VGARFRSPFFVFSITISLVDSLVETLADAECVYRVEILVNGRTMWSRKGTRERGRPRTRPHVHAHRHTHPHTAVVLRDERSGNMAEILGICNTCVSPSI
jgi:hypothetical protein